MNDGIDHGDDEMNCGLTIDEHACLRRELRALPDTSPPRAVWERISEQAAAEGLVNRRMPGERLRWLAGSGIAAAVVLAVLNLPVGNEGPGADVTAGPELPVVPPYNAEEERYDPINALMVQSRLMEEDLRSIPEQPALARADTLATIDELQSRIAEIDYELSDPESTLSRQEQETYWRERVRLLESLINLRFAQAQRAWF